MAAAARRGGRGLTGLAARDDNSRFKRVLFAPAPPRRPGPARGRPRVTNGIPEPSSCATPVPTVLPASPPLRWPRPDRKSVVSGKSVAVRVVMGGRRIIKKKKKPDNKKETHKRK